MFINKSTILLFEDIFVLTDGVVWYLRNTDSQFRIDNFLLLLLLLLTPIYVVESSGAWTSQVSDKWLLRLETNFGLRERPV